MLHDEKSMNLEKYSNFLMHCECILKHKYMIKKDDVGA